MKKINLFLLLLLCSMLVFPQAKKEQVQLLSGVTVANSSKTVAYILDLQGTDLIPSTDSVTFKIIAKGEVDLDTIVVEKGVMYNGTFYATATRDSTTLTIDNAAGVITAVIVSATNTTANLLEAIEAIKVTIIAAASGNDATDPNALYLYAIKHYTLSVTKPKIN